MNFKEIVSTEVPKFYSYGKKLVTHAELNDLFNRPAEQLNTADEKEQFEHWVNLDMDMTQFNEYMKIKHSSRGFLNEMTSKKLYNFLINNSKLKEITNDSSPSEDESSCVDDETIEQSKNE
jgi:hypothetical protein